MVISSNRSPSPISSRTNPNSRTPESGTRKSFSGNPFTKPSIVSNRRSFNPVTPANSPAEFSQRNCKEGVSLRASYEQKENEKDNMKPVRARSPAVSSTGTKNFMAPTISAASKIAAASPRKKILGERNEAVRVSDSISDEKFCHSEFVEEIGSKTPITLEALSMAAPLISEATTTNILTTPKNNRSSIPISAENPLLNSMNQLDFSTVQEIEAKSDENLISETLPESRILSSTKIKAPPLSSPLAPLDADPSVPPYDPKTNYLSPRPLFLHYRPNPRIEVYLNKETEFNPGEGGKRLEDSFSSESCSDSENTEETQDSDPQKESEDVSSEGVSEEEKETTHLLHENNDIIRVKKISNLCFSARSKIMPLLLVLVVACMSFPVTDSPLYNSSMYKDHQTSSKLEASTNIVELAKANLDGLSLAYNFKLWLLKSTFYLSNSKPIPIVFEELRPFLAVNLTALDQEFLVYESQTLDYGEKGTIEQQEKNSFEPEKEGEIEEEPEEDWNFMGIETGVKTEEQSSLISQAAESELEMLGDSNQNFLQTEAEEKAEEALVVQEHNKEIEDQSSLIPQGTEIELEMLEVQNAVQIEIEERIEEANTEEFGNKEIEEQSPLIPQLPEVEPVTSEATEFHDDEETNIEPINAELTPQISESDTPSHSSEPKDDSSISDDETLESVIHDSEEKFAQTVLGISSVLLILMASTAFVYLRSKKASSTTTTAEAPVVVKGLPSKKVSSSSSLSASGDSQHPYLERLSSQNWPSTHVEMTGQSGPLEVSTSYQHSSSCNPRGSERVSEAESQERKPRRNSNRDNFASPSEYSSGLSPSYGSFTTYEKIHSKHGYGEDEVVTPVRRSSRIRKLVTSP